MAILRRRKRNIAIMRTIQYTAEALSGLFETQETATMTELMGALGTNARRTVYRKLKELGYRTSYSHRGAHYAPDQGMSFDELGLWSCGNVRFSMHGTLLSTVEAIVKDSPCGYFPDELDNILHVGTRDCLRKLVGEARLKRSRIDGRFLHTSPDSARERRQVLARRDMPTAPGTTGPLHGKALVDEDLRASIVLFFSMLDEKTRRLYAGLEALKTGRGGDARIADLLGLSVGTVARGRRELLARDVEAGRIRKKGGGRKKLEKKRRKSSGPSRNS
jgi:hypothetical protein